MDLSGKVLRVFETDSGQADLAWTEDYIYRDGQLLAKVFADGSGGESNAQFHLDHLGSPLLKLAQQPAGTWSYHQAFFPFGERAFSGSPGGRMQFTGHERDLNQPGQVDDLDYMHARYYGPLMGRFLSPDLVNGHPAIPQSWNRYAYVYGNPINHTDPAGMVAIPVSLWYLAKFTFSEEITVVGDDHQLSPFPGGGGFGHKAQYELMTLPRRLGKAFLSELGRQLELPNTGMQCLVIGGEVYCGEARIAMMPITPGGIGRIDPNKLNHIFGKAAHNLDEVAAAAGSREAAYVAMERGAQAAVDAGKITGLFEVTVNVAGHPVTVRGKVIDGVARIGTAFK